MDLYDINKVNTHKTIVRGEKVPEGYYRLVVHVCIFNKKGEMLIQKRSDAKKFWPSKWDVSVGGCADEGESSGQAMTRELKEELGLDFDFTKIRPTMCCSFGEGYDDIYIINMDVDVSSVVLQKEEVSEVRYASLKEIKKLIKKDLFISFQDHFIDFVFEMRNKTELFKN